jgi:hypothetical protein
MRRHFLLPLLLAVLALSGCTDEVIVSSQDALADSRIAPRVAWTIPPLNGTGPYAAWGASVGDSYLMTVRFNKLMTSASVAGGFRLGSTARPLVIDILASADNLPREMFTLVPRDSGGFLFTPPRIGEVLTLSTAKQMMDVNGNILAPGVLGTILPEPYFRVKRTSPADPEELLSPFGTITITFNSAVDTSIRRFITTRPPAAAPWTIRQEDSTTIDLAVESMRPSPSYAVTVAAGAHDKAGHAMPAPYSAFFQSVQFLVQPYSVPADTVGVDLFREFDFAFTHALDTATVRGALHLSPAAAVRLKFFGGSSFGVVPVQDFDPSTRYALVIDTSLHEASSLPLVRPVGFTFTTAAFRVSGTTPSTGSTGVPVGDDIVIGFTGHLDTSTVRRSFSITPAADGVFFPDPRTPSFTYFLGDTLRSFTTYTVTVDTSIRSARGLRLAAPYAFTFTTGRP